MLTAIINFFKKPAPAPKAPTPYKVETPTAVQKADTKPATKKATAKKPVVKKTTRKPKAPTA